MRLLTTPRALHAIARLVITAGLGVLMVTGDAAVGSGAQAAPVTAAVARPALRPAAARPSAPRRKRVTKRLTTRVTKRVAKRVTTRRSASRRAAPVRIARRSAATPRIATAELPPVPVFALPDLAALFPGDSAVLSTRAVALDAAPRRPFASFSRSASHLLDQMVGRARGQLGTRYVLGGTEPGRGLDCSSFARYAMEAIGIKLPRTAAQQARVGQAVPKDRGALRPGDLLTFGTARTVSHVGIYLGEDRFIHASVGSGQVIETTFARNGWLLRRWTGARRLIASSDSATERGG